MTTLRVKNWTKFQHYRDRCPPWIKLATDTFQNYEFSRLHDASKLLAVCIWTIAARSRDGTVPADFEYIKGIGRLGPMIKQEHLKELINQGFVEMCSDTLAERKQSDCSETEEEGEGETERRSAPLLLGEPEYPEDFERFWQAITSNRPKGSKQLAAKAWRKHGRPTADVLISKWNEYRTSLGDGYAKDISTWLNIPGWRETWTPAVNARSVANGSKSSPTVAKHARDWAGR